MFVAIRDFMEAGGPVLNFVAIAILLMWILIVERIIYFRGEHRSVFAATVAYWTNRKERYSWKAHRVRELLVSRSRLAANGPIPLIKTFVALCPLLGLLGTVTGMIEVFDVLAISGTGNARSMAAGVSRATIPTMAGMVGALSGVFAATLLARTASREVERLEENLVFDGAGVDPSRRRRKRHPEPPPATEGSS
jgi:biopolymer transport protein ExbB